MCEPHLRPDGRSPSQQVRHDGLPCLVKACSELPFRSSSTILAPSVRANSFPHLRVIPVPQSYACWENEFFRSLNGSQVCDPLAVGQLGYSILSGTAQVNAKPSFASLTKLSALGSLAPHLRPVRRPAAEILRPATLPITVNALPSAA